MKYLIANWKAQMTLNDILEWLRVFMLSLQNNQTLITKLKNNELSIVICPPFPFIPTVRDHIKNITGMYVGAQDVSTVAQGKYTGEVTADALKDIADYVIVGHSERREHFHETEKQIELKMSLADQYSIRSIQCVRNEQDAIYDHAKLIAYEPVEAIGTGANAAVEDVLSMKKRLSIPENVPFLYGGSADTSNIHDYLKTHEVDGFLVGTASLDAKEFYQMAIQMIS